MAKNRRNQPAPQKPIRTCLAPSLRIALPDGSTIIYRRGEHIPDNHAALVDDRSLLTPDAQADAPEVTPEPNPE